jgi:hypothetical protein
MDQVVIYGLVGPDPFKIIRPIPVVDFPDNSGTLHTLGFYVRPLYSQNIKPEFSTNVAPNAVRLSSPISFITGEENYFGVHSISSLYALNTVNDFVGLPIKGIPAPFIDNNDLSNNTPQSALSVAPFVFNDNQQIRPVQRPGNVVSDFISPGNISVALASFSPDTVGICFGYAIYVTGNASYSLGGGTLEILVEFDDGLGNNQELGIHTVFVPSTAATTGGNLLNTGWINFGFGIESQFVAGSLMARISGTVAPLDTGDVVIVAAIGSRPNV